MSGVWKAPTGHVDHCYSSTELGSKRDHETVSPVCGKARHPRDVVSNAYTCGKRCPDCIRRSR